MSSFWKKKKSQPKLCTRYRGTILHTFCLKCVHYYAINEYIYVGVKKDLQIFIFRMILIFGMKLAELNGTGHPKKPTQISNEIQQLKLKISYFKSTNTKLISEVKSLRDIPIREGGYQSVFSVFVSPWWRFRFNWMWDSRYYYMTKNISFIWLVKSMTFLLHITLWILSKPSISATIDFDRSRGTFGTLY